MKVYKEVKSMLKNYSLSYTKRLAPYGASLFLIRRSLA